MTAATSPALALPELPRSYIILGQHPESNLSWRWVVMEKHDVGYLTVNGYTAAQMTTYGQQCAQAQGEAQAAEIKRLRHELRALMSGYTNLVENGRDRIASLGGQCDPFDEMVERDPWLRAARAALKSEAA